MTCIKEGAFIIINKEIVLSLTAQQSNPLPGTDVVALLHCCFTSTVNI